MCPKCLWPVSLVSYVSLVMPMVHARAYGVLGALGVLDVLGVLSIIGVLDVLGVIGDHGVLRRCLWCPTCPSI